jgi:hypothetical protein
MARTTLVRVASNLQHPKMGYQMQGKNLKLNFFSKFSFSGMSPELMLLNVLTSTFTILASNTLC